MKKFEWDLKGDFHMFYGGTPEECEKAYNDHLENGGDDPEFIDERDWLQRLYYLSDCWDFSKAYHEKYDKKKK